MYKIGVIGDRESILGFSSLGLDIFPVDSADETEAVLKDPTRMQDYAVFFITEEAAKAAQSFLSMYRSRRTPAIILIPGKGGSLGLGMADVKKSVEKAVGADILFK